MRSYRARGSARAPRRALTLLLGRFAVGAVIVATSWWIAVPHPASAGEEPPPTQPPGGVPGNPIPRPNSGHEPENPGDRGGWVQLTLLALTVGGVAVIVLLVWREATRRRDQ